VWVRCLFPLMNLMFLMVSSLVFHVPETLTYSHDRMAKKKAPEKSLHRVLSKGERARQCSIHRIEAVMTTCGLVGGSVDKYPRNCHCRMYASFWYPSNLGLAQSAILKA
jgi:hypothetical protein